PQHLPDVIISNAVLQWVPDHRELLVRWVDQLAKDGWLAFQVPGNFDQPSHAILREMAASARWRLLLRDVELNRQSADPADYAELLARAGCARRGPGRGLPRRVRRAGPRGVSATPVRHHLPLPPRIRRRPPGRLTPYAHP